MLLRHQKENLQDHRYPNPATRTSWQWLCACKQRTNLLVTLCSPRWQYFQINKVLSRLKSKVILCSLHSRRWQCVLKKGLNATGFKRALSRTANYLKNFSLIFLTLFHSLESSTLENVGYFVNGKKDFFYRDSGLVRLRNLSPSYPSQLRHFISKPI